jgi:rSAM/selenodomain-associated transferase 2
VISVIIPTLNEAAALPGLLQALARQGETHEIIVADGGSTDGTVSLALASGARVFSASKGRGAQLAAGAAAAGGEVLWFVHADSKVPYAAMRALLRALEDPRVAGGNFRVLFDGDTRFDRFMTWFYGVVRRLGLFYGDSGIFVRRAVYGAVGGMRALALMEDHDFARRLRRAGRVACVRFPPLVTSSRRFRGRHPVAIMAGWFAIHALFALGAPPRLLARLYRSTVQSPGLRAQARHSATNRIRIDRSPERR